MRNFNSFFFDISVIYREFKATSASDVIYFKRFEIYANCY